MPHSNIKDNTIRIRSNFSPVVGENGQINAILEICTDTALEDIIEPALKNTMEELLESKAHLELIRDIVPAMIFYLDTEQRYKSCNKVFCEWFNATPHEVIGKTVREFLGEVTYEKTRPHLEIVYNGTQERYELFAPSRMGIPRWLDIVYTPHKNNTGNVVGVIVHATDVTQSKKIEIALRESENIT